MDALLKCLDNVLFTFSMSIRMLEKYELSGRTNNENLELFKEFVLETKRHIKILIKKKNGIALLTLMCLGGNIKINDNKTIPKIRELEECFNACEKHGIIDLIKEVISNTALFTF